MQYYQGFVSVTELSSFYNGIPYGWKQYGVSRKPRFYCTEPEQFAAQHFKEFRNGPVPTLAIWDYVLSRFPYFL